MTKGLCEFTGGCKLYQFCVKRNDEDAVLQIDEICNFPAERVTESCYQKKQDLYLNKWRDRNVG